MVVSKRKSLAGINGIPLEQDQYADSVVFGVSSRASIARGTVGKVLLPGGRVWNVGNILRKREYGGELFGSFVVTTRSRSEDQRRTSGGKTADGSLAKGHKV